LPDGAFGATFVKMTTMRRLVFFVFAVIAAGGVFVVPVANADAPSPGDSCASLHAVTQDANGRNMWCNPTMTGNHSLVWQYGGPS
jgi:hypothetical protein